MSNNKKQSKDPVTLIKGKINQCTNINVNTPVLVESIEIDNKPAFLISRLNDGNLTISGEIETVHKKFVPISGESCPYDTYKFLDGNEINKPVIDFTELYTRVFSEVDIHVDIEEELKHLITTCILFTYRQDQSSTTPYLYIVGDNDSGKSTILHLMKSLGYRPLLSDSLPHADIYGFLGTIEEASGIILEDEAQGLDYDREKLKIYKGGYVKGSRIPRIKEVSGTSKILYHYGYSFKALAGEKLPEDNGFLQRCIIIHMVEGLPSANIKDLKPEDVKRLSQLRNDLMLWRMQTAHKQLPDIDLDFIKNRDAEIWKPLLRIVYSSKFFDTLVTLAKDQVTKRHKEKIDSCEAILFGIVRSLLIGNKEILFNDIWTGLTSLPGQTDQQNSQAFLLDDYGKVTKTSMGRILSDKFKGVKDRTGGKRVYKFESLTIAKLERKYGLYGLHSNTTHLTP